MTALPMSGLRNIHNFWDGRSQHFQSLRSMQTKPKPIELPKPRLQLVPKPTPAPKSERGKAPRMEKVTSIETKLMTQDRIEMSKRSGEWGYMQKLVKRGLYRQTATQGHVVTFAKVSPREQAGQELAALIKGKTGFTSHSSLRQAQAS